MDVLFSLKKKWMLGVMLILIIAFFSKKKIYIKYREKKLLKFRSHKEIAEDVHGFQCMYVKTSVRERENIVIKVKRH